MNIRPREGNPSKPLEEKLSAAETQNPEEEKSARPIFNLALSLSDIKQSTTTQLDFSRHQALGNRLKISDDTPPKGIDERWVDKGAILELSENSYILWYPRSTRIKDSFSLYRNGSFIVGFKHAGGISHIVKLPDGTIVSGSTEDKTIMHWDINNQQRLATIEVPALSDLYLSPSDSHLITVSSDNSTKIWTQNNSSLEVIAQHSGPQPLTILKDGSAIARCPENTRSLIRYDLQTSNRLTTFAESPHEIDSVFALQDDSLITISTNGISRWDTSNGACLKSIAIERLHRRTVEALADGTIVFQSASDVKRLDMINGKDLGTIGDGGRYGAMIVVGNTIYTAVADYETNRTDTGLDYIGDRLVTAKLSTEPLQLSHLAPLFIALRTNTNVTTLNLQHVNFDKSAASKELATLINQNRTLTTLDIRNTNVSQSVLNDLFIIATSHNRPLNILHDAHLERKLNLAIVKDTDNAGSTIYRNSPVLTFFGIEKTLEDAKNELEKTTSCVIC